MMVWCKMIGPFWFGYCRERNTHVFGVSCYPIRGQLQLALCGVLPVIAWSKLNH